MLGKLLGGITRIVNIPLRATENALDALSGEDAPTQEEDRVISKPLDALADELEDLDKD